VVTIAHISDPHVGSPYFVPNLMNRVIVELNERGELPDDPGELEAGANRCAVV
jgi:DNA polymerase II small subunit/DNA polymerase delta subunit B